MDAVVVITPARLAVDATGVVHPLDLTGYWQLRASDGVFLAKVDVEPSPREHGITMVNQIDVSETLSAPLRRGLVWHAVLHEPRNR